MVDVWAQEFYRQDPLGVELRQRIQDALRAVGGVTGVYEHYNESWDVTRHPLRGGPDPRSGTRCG